jgi:hypothetical protein
MSATGEETPPRRRGEAAWKADRAAVDERNEQARKAGRQERKEQERRASELRRAADLREQAEIESRFGSRLR